MRVGEEAIVKDNHDVKLWITEFSREIGLLFFFHAIIVNCNSCNLSIEGGLR